MQTCFLNPRFWNLNELDEQIILHEVKTISIFVFLLTGVEPTLRTDKDENVKHTLIYYVIMQKGKSLGLVWFGFLLIREKKNHRKILLSSDF